jgi:hypothetical protein
MEFFPVPTRPSFSRMRFNIEFTGNARNTFRFRRTPTVNYAQCVFIENKRYPRNQGATRDVVNQNAASVYQTEALLDLISHSRRE